MTDRLNIDEAAAYLEVSKNTLYWWRSLDRGPRCHKVRNKLYWLKSDCDQWLVAQMLDSARGGIR